MSDWAEKIGSTVKIMLPHGLTRVTHTTGTIERVTSTLAIVKTAEGKVLKFNLKGELPNWPHRRQYGSYANGRKAMMSQQKEGA